MAPLKGQDQKLVVRERAKVNLLADHFAAKFRAEDLEGTGGSRAERRDKRAMFAPVWGRFGEFRAVELYKALHGMTSGKAPGPDCLAAALFKNLHSPFGSILRVFYCIIKTGRFPNLMSRLYIAPINKPDKDATLCKSKRPISLMCVISKLLEPTVSQRLAPAVEKGLGPGQFAYRGERGTEFHLLQVYGLVCEEIEKGKFAYLAAADIDGAFDNVPHDVLVASSVGAGADRFLCRYVAKWFQRRTFGVKLTTPAGVFISGWRPMSRGLPQGGVLSPLLWLVHVNPMREMVSTRLAENGVLGIDLGRMALLYADDMVIALSLIRIPMHLLRRQGMKMGRMRGR